jgi:hypothetical protein
MPVIPEGSISLAQENLRVTLADSATFRALVGATTRSAAAARIHHEGLPDPGDGTEHTLAELEALRPLAIVFTSESQGFRRRKLSTNAFRSSGRLRLRLCRSCNAAGDAGPTTDATKEWKNIVGKVIDELCELSLSGNSDYLAFDEVAVEWGPFAAAPELAATQGMWQGVELSFGWGGV